MKESVDSETNFIQLHGPLQLFIQRHHNYLNNHITITISATHREYLFHTLSNLIRNEFGGTLFHDANKHLSLPTTRTKQ